MADMKTVFLGLITIVLLVGLVIFGLPLLIKFSIFLGDIRKKTSESDTEIKIAPLPPRLVVPFEATNSALIKIKGVAEEGVVVELLKNDVMIGKTEVSVSSDFEFDAIDLDLGDNSFKAIGINPSGNSSEASREVVINYDNVAPTLQMVNPSEVYLIVDYADFDVVGISEKGVSAWVNNHVAVVDDEGRFKYKLQLAAGDNAIEVRVKDLAGNETKKEIKIKYDI